MAHQDLDDKLRQKQSFYDGMHCLSGDDDAPDPGLQSSLAKLHKKTPKPNQGTTARVRGLGERMIPPDAQVAQSSPRRLPRSTSDGHLAESTHASLSKRSVAALPSTAIPAFTLPASLKTRHTFSGVVPSSSAVPRATGKRKRDSAINMQPEAQQIFRGLNFYFFPNSDTNAARRMRITKSLEFGATWQKEWNDSITHVIMDKSIDYGSLIKFLKVDALAGSVIVANETWPSSCMAYRAVIDASQPQFHVRGAPTLPKPVKKVTAVEKEPERSDMSLPLKPAGRARGPETPRSHSPSPTRNESPLEDARPEPRAAVTQPKLISEPVINSAEFDAAVSQIKELRHLPLDEEDSDELGQENPRPKLKNKLQTMQDKFQCMDKHTGDSSNSPNAPTIAILQQMADYYGQIGDEWRIRAYRKAIATLRNHPKKVNTKDEALALPNVGERLATKIEEIAYTNRLQRLDNARAEPSDQVLQTFMQVYGAGFQQANKWVSQGFTTLDELLQKADLTDNQRIGIEHYEDFESRIPRSEVAQHGAVVKRNLQRIESSFEVIIGGSYRRGAEDSGDVDCIITHPTAGINHIRAVVLDQLVPRLTAKGFLTAALAATSRDDGTKWHGASCLPGSKIWRRIDLLLVPLDEMGAALIYFTGNDIFNRSLRLLASTKGMRLNQRGLYKDVIRGKGREKLTDGTLVEGRDEKRIFEVLGVPWRPPEHRIP